jgi:phosphatidylinositol 4-phosphatase
LIDLKSYSFGAFKLHTYALPLIQGFFQVSSFQIPREPELGETGDAAVVDYIIMSRRSRDRAGLRYQRRGVDDDAHVANFVETETITRIEVSMALKC